MRSPAHAVGYCLGNAAERKRVYMFNAKLGIKEGGGNSIAKPEHQNT